MTPQREIPRLALTREEAAASLGISLSTFRDRVQPDLQIVRMGRVRMIPVAELERWISENAERPMLTEIAA